MKSNNSKSNQPPVLSLLLICLFFPIAKAAGKDNKEMSAQQAEGQNQFISQDLQVSGQDQKVGL